MRKTAFLVGILAALLAGCVTINVYFPAAAAQKAADQVIGNILGAEPPSASAPATSAPPASSSHPAADAALPNASRGVAAALLDALVPAAQAAEPSANLDVKTPAIKAIEARMRVRFNGTLKTLLAAGAVGFTHNGDVALHDAARIPLAQRAAANAAIAAENADRAELYQQVSIANGHPEWAQSMREAFAKRWISFAKRAGWYYQDASGNWQHG